MSFGFGFGFTKITAAIRAAFPPAFSPASLFANNEPGVWYDPSDFSTLYQDAAGTVPVTGVEQPVGLMLDKSKGLVLGPELVDDSNMIFAGGSSRISAGVYRLFSETGTTSYFSQNGVPAGKFYSVSFRISNVVSAGAGVVVSDSFGASWAGAPGLAGNYTRVVYLQNNARVTFTRQSGITDFYIDNISVRELPGNHAYQPTTTSRPVLSARVNLLRETEQFNDTAWTKRNATVTANADVAPDGTTTADRLEANGSTTYLYQSLAGLANAPYTLSVSVLKGTSFTIAADNQSSIGTGVTFDGTTGAFVTLNKLSNGYAVSSYSCITHPLNSGYWLASITLTVNAGNNNVSVWINTAKSATYASGGQSTIGDMLTVWGASLVRADQAHLPYQRVNTATDYDTAGFPHYLRFDGVDDWLVTNTITPGIDKVQVFAGVRRVANGGIPIELSAVGSNAGSFYVYAGNRASAAGATWTISSHGSATDNANQSVETTANYNAPLTNLVTGIYDIAGDSTILRINASQIGTATGDQGTGNYGNYPLYIGRRGGTSFPFNGHLYSLIVRFGSNLPIETIEQVEAWINGQTGAY